MKYEKQIYRLSKQIFKTISSTNKKNRHQINPKYKVHNSICFHPSQKKKKLIKKTIYNLK